MKFYIKEYLHLNNWSFSIKFSIVPIIAVIVLSLITYNGISTLKYQRETTSVVISDDMGGALNILNVQNKFKKINGNFFAALVDQSTEITDDDQFQERLTKLSDNIILLISEIEGYTRIYSSGKQKEILIGKNTYDKLLEDFGTKDLKHLDIDNIKEEGIDVFSAVKLDFYKTLGNESLSVIYKKDSVAGQLAVYGEAIGVIQSFVFGSDLSSIGGMLVKFSDNSATVDMYIQQIVKGIVASANDRGSKSNIESEYAISQFMYVSVGSILLIIVITILMAYNTTKSIEKIATVTRKLADHDLGVDIESVNRHDELSSIVDSLRIFKESIEMVDHLEKDRKKTDIRIKQERNEAMEVLAQSFESKIKVMLDSVIASTVEVSSSTDVMDDVSHQTGDLTNKVQYDCHQLSDNMDTISEITNKLTESVQDVSVKMKSSVERSNKAVEQSASVNETVGAMVDASQEINAIGHFIKDISHQINLLSLNATIEAVRAGEAGAGFAVVASEVKELSLQTASAIEKIALQVTTIQKVSQDTADALSEMGAVIQDISDISNNVYDATNDQSKAVAEVAIFVGENVNYANKVNESIVVVKKSVVDTQESSEKVKSELDNVNNYTHSLDQEVNNFLTMIRTDHS
jgi:methyl-accepting chemotaxis protein